MTGENRDGLSGVDCPALPPPNRERVAPAAPPLSVVGVPPLALVAVAAAKSPPEAEGCWKRDEEGDDERAGVFEKGVGDADWEGGSLSRFPNKDVVGAVA